ncbi:unnamed protein product [Pieris macdunnoughi]|uniref:Uncharacterized protein n=1 Tax=Pieris macdunnoughi TaxID=345717 RepID=A0A821QQG4_9NEOP|nr:unnamed protein product [Pieris macdunnoughi]
MWSKIGFFLIFYYFHPGDSQDAVTKSSQTVEEEERLSEFIANAIDSFQEARSRGPSRGEDTRPIPCSRNKEEPSSWRVHSL